MYISYILISSSKFSLEIWVGASTWNKTFPFFGQMGMGIDGHRLQIPEIGPKIGQKFALDKNKHHHDVQRHLIIKSSYINFSWEGYGGGMV